MRQKLITLDPTSFEIASKMPNFSAWVRDQLRSHRNKNQTTLGSGDIADIMDGELMDLYHIVRLVLV